MPHLLRNAVDSIDFYGSERRTLVFDAEEMLDDVTNLGGHGIHGQSCHQSSTFRIMIIGPTPSYSWTAQRAPHKATPSKNIPKESRTSKFAR